MSTLQSAVLKCMPRTSESVRPLLLKALQDASAQLSKRSIPARLFGEQSPAGDPYGLEAAITEGEALRTEIVPGPTKNNVTLNTLLSANSLGRGCQLESRQAYEQAREERRAANRAAHEKEQAAFMEAMKGHHLVLEYHKEQEAKALSMWNAGAGTRGAVVSSKRRLLRSVGILCMLGGLVGTGTIYYYWPLASYYKEVTTAWMVFIVVKLLALVFPWIVMAVPIVVGWSCFAAASQAAAHVREPAFQPPHPPRMPEAPRPVAEEVEEPFDVLDTTEKVKSYCMEVVSKAVTMAARTKLGSR